MKSSKGAAKVKESTAAEKYRLIQAQQLIDGLVTERRLVQEPTSLEKVLAELREKRIKKAMRRQTLDLSGLQNAAQGLAANMWCSVTIHLALDKSVIIVQPDGKRRRVPAGKIIRVRTPQPTHDDKNI
jgi:hypothetical protein